MKKILSILFSIVYMLIISSIVVYAETETDVILKMQVDNSIMTVNGTEKEIDFGQGTSPIIFNNRTLVPVRSIIEKLGGIVDWAENEQTATLTYEDNEINLTINSTTAYFNGEAYTIDTAPTTINNRTMLPIRF